MFGSFFPLFCHEDISVGSTITSDPEYNVVEPVWNHMLYKQPHISTSVNRLH